MDGGSREIGRMMGSDGICWVMVVGERNVRVVIIRVRRWVVGWIEKSGVVIIGVWIRSDRIVGGMCWMV